MQIVTHNKNNRLQELKDLSLRRKHRKKKKIDCSLTKLFQPRKHKNNDKTVINFTRTYSHNHQKVRKNLEIAFKTMQIKNILKHLMTKKILLAAGQRGIKMLFIF